MKSRRLLVWISTLGMLSTAAMAGGTWTMKADMPTARYGLATSTIDGKLYALGGAITLSAIATVEQYDPTTDTWQRRADMPVASTGLATSVVDGMIYAIGGGQGVLGEGRSTVYAYDPASDTWTTGADMPTPRIVLSTSVVGGKIYAIGGKRRHGEAGISTVEEYDPITDTWTRKADMPTPRFALSTSVVDGKIYAMGGLVYQDDAGLKAVEEYDPATDTWTKRSDMPLPTMGLATCVVHGKIFAIGGGPVLSAAGGARVDEYDPQTDSWAGRADMPTGRLLPSAGAVNGRIYVIGGSVRAWPWMGVSVVEEYDLAPPPPDFNGDGAVDINDLLRLIESWGLAAPMCDIAPVPLGDGVVDAADLEMLMSYWGQELNDPTLVAYWKFDETQGDIAFDSAGENRVTLLGWPIWRPDQGVVDGALELDGMSDAGIADFVLNPPDGPFSIFLWIKGGSAGQVLISQVGGANWLMADTSQGFLMTELKSAGRLGRALCSETTIVDGAWHRVGLTWDGSARRLYVDDIAVAEDTDAGLTACYGGLNIGCGENMAPGTFFSGLIDDVRVYSRALQP